MKEYEAVWEIFNSCANNQMRDVFFEELELEDPEQYILEKFKDKELKYEKSMWFCIVLDCNRNVYHDAPSQSGMGCYSAVNFPCTRVSSVLLLRSKKNPHLYKHRYGFHFHSVLCGRLCSFNAS